MKKIQKIISLAIMVLVVAACTEDATTEDGMVTVDQMFQQIKAAYSGSYMSANNTVRSMDIIIDDQANVVVEDFPLDLILAKLYPYDYASIPAPVDSVGLKAPIKGFNIDPSLNFIDFSTDEGGTAPIEFAFKKDDTLHSGWAMIYVVGLYNMYMKTLTIQFSVTDLIVDGQDMQEMTPIDYFIDRAQK